jgi:hypothetical protein
MTKKSRARNSHSSKNNKNEDKIKLIARYTIEKTECLEVTTHRLTIPSETDRK